MTDSAIKIEKLCKSFASVQVLNQIDLTVSTGEFTGLIGVNGAGKTTLIKCLLDFCDVTSGSIEIFGTAHTRKEARKNLVFLPERFMPPYYLSGKDFLVYMAELHGVEYSNNKVTELFRILDLDLSALAKPVREFSKGMAQKLGLASCLMSEKDLLVLDEPMSGLDPKARAYLKQYLIELKDAGKTIFFSTHMLADIEVLCDRVAILHEGRIRFTGSIEECTSEFNADNLEQAYLACVGA
ncbi:MAG: ABC transporter ATP-binding protein [Gammaproteobacteria bacterium]|nr:MAG: ABC transporter ATP-binding protein [Gammaproteobacteria bacterium]RKZ71752.1 MAG: ABC transporter ATP-binding protein [Gammaproteobacteria bacterium]